MAVVCVAVSNTIASEKESNGTFPLQATAGGIKVVLLVFSDIFDMLCLL